MRNLKIKKIISSQETAVSLFIKNVYDKNIKTLFSFKQYKAFFFQIIQTHIFFLSDITKHILFFQITQSTPVFGGNIRINYATHPTGRARGNQPLNWRRLPLPPLDQGRGRGAWCLSVIVGQHLFSRDTTRPRRGALTTGELCVARGGGRRDSHQCLVYRVLLFSRMTGARRGEQENAGLVRLF